MDKPNANKKLKFSYSVSIIKEIFDNRMVTLSAEGYKARDKIIGAKTNLS